jgi:hypothetical protein
LPVFYFAVAGSVIQRREQNVLRPIATARGWFFWCEVK